MKKFTNDGKTFIEVLALILTAIFYPGVNLSMTAQTRESACGLIEDKFSEIMGFYPLLMECVEHYSFTKDKALIIFKNGSRITNLANHQSSKGENLLPSHTFSRGWRGLSIKIANEEGSARHGGANLVGNSFLSKRRPVSTISVKESRAPIHTAFETGVATACS